jgi:Amt family ammonium transporter
MAGNPTFFAKQCIAVLGAAAWAFAFTYGVLWAINQLTPVKVEEHHEKMGLDEALHGERAYTEA